MHAGEVAPSGLAHVVGSGIVSHVVVDVVQIVLEHHGIQEAGLVLCAGRWMGVGASGGSVNGVHAVAVMDHVDAIGCVQSCMACVSCPFCVLAELH